MGMAAGQARLLSITARLSDNELRAQIINNDKMRLATQSSQVSEAYVTALNNAQMMFTNYDANNNQMYQQLTFNALTAYNPYNNQYAISNASGNILLSEADAANYEKAKASSNPLETFLALYGLEQSSSYFENTLSKYTTEDGTVYFPSQTQYLGDDGLEYYANFDTGYTPDELKAMYYGGEVKGKTCLGYQDILQDNKYWNYVTAMQNYVEAYEAYQPAVIGNIRTWLMEKDYKTKGATDGTGVGIDFKNFSSNYLSIVKVFDNSDGVFNSLKEVVFSTASADDSFANKINEMKTYATDAGKIILDGYLNKLKAEMNAVTEQDTAVISGYNSFGSEGLVYQASGGTLTINEVSYPDDTATTLSSEVAFKINKTTDGSGNVIYEATVANQSNTIKLKKEGSNYILRYESTYDEAGNLTSVSAINNQYPNKESYEVLKINADFLEKLCAGATPTDVDKVIKTSDDTTSSATYYVPKEGYSPVSCGTLVASEIAYRAKDVIDEIIFNAGSIFDPENSFFQTDASNALLTNMNNAYLVLYNSVYGTSYSQYSDIPDKNEDFYSDMLENYLIKYSSGDVNSDIADDQMINGFEWEVPDYFEDIRQVLLLDRIMDFYGEPSTAWVDVNNPQENGNAKAKWYENLFNRIEDGGYRTLKNGLASSTEWIQFAFENGIITLEQVDDKYTWNKMIYSNCSDITEQTNDAAVAKAEAEYKAAMNKIENKDKRYDMQLKNIDTEHNSLQTEYESIKGAIDKNIERTFKMYS